MMRLAIQEERLCSIGKETHRVKIVLLLFFYVLLKSVWIWKCLFPKHQNKCRWIHVFMHSLQHWYGPLGVETFSNRRSLSSDTGKPRASSARQEPPAESHKDGADRYTVCVCFLFVVYVYSFNLNIYYACLVIIVFVSASSSLCLYVSLSLSLPFSQLWLKAYVWGKWTGIDTLAKSSEYLAKSSVQNSSNFMKCSG